MIRLVSLGVAAAFFFSSTFVLNRWMSVEGGHWFWTAALRYAYVFILLTPLIAFRYGRRSLWESGVCLVQYRWLWLVAGGIGFGCFYSALCFAASFAPGWVVATTWQCTILATPLVLRVFGRRVPSRGVLYAGIAVVGVLLVNASQFGRFSLEIGYGV